MLYLFMFLSSLSCFISEHPQRILLYELVQIDWSERARGLIRRHSISISVYIEKLKCRKKIKTRCNRELITHPCKSKLSYRSLSPRALWSVGPCPLEKSTMTPWWEGGRSPASLLVSRLTCWVLATESKN